MRTQSRRRAPTRPRSRNGPICPVHACGAEQRHRKTNLEYSTVHAMPCPHLIHGDPICTVPDQSRPEQSDETG